MQWILTFSLNCVNSQLFVNAIVTANSATGLSNAVITCDFEIECVAVLALCFTSLKLHARKNEREI